MIDALGKAVQQGLNGIGAAVRAVEDLPADALEKIPLLGSPLGATYRTLAQIALQPVHASVTGAASYVGGGLSAVENSLSELKGGWRFNVASEIEVHKVAAHLRKAGVDPTAGSFMLLYAARESAEFKSGHELVGNATELGVLDRGRIEMIEAYTQMGLKKALVESLEDPKRSMGELDEDDLALLYGSVELAGKRKPDGTIERNKKGHVMTDVSGDLLIKSILEGIESAKLHKGMMEMPDKDGKSRNVEAWVLENGHKFPESARVAIRAQIIGAHMDGRTALEYKKDQIIDALEWKEEWTPTQSNNFRSLLAVCQRADGLLATLADTVGKELIDAATTIARKGT